jgi:hypothetical protein
MALKNKPLGKNIDWNCKSTVLQLVESSGYLLEHASERLKNDRDIVYAAIKNHAPSLMHASDYLRDDRQLVVNAVRQHGRSLEYVSARLKADTFIVENAVKNDPKAIKYASERLWKLPHIRKYLHTRGNPTELPVILLLQNNKLGYYMDDEYFCNYHVEDGVIRLDGYFGYNQQGFYADLGLYLPPVDYDIDAWEGSRLAGQSDNWNFLKIFCVPATSLQAGEEINEYVAIVSFKSSTFFDRPNEIIQIIELKKEAPKLNEFVRNADTCPDLGVAEVWSLFFAVCEKKFGAKELLPYIE